MIETYFIWLILAIQAYVFINILLKLRSYSKIIPQLGKYSLIEADIEDDEDVAHNEDDIKIIKVEKDCHEDFHDTADKINRYIINNRKNVPDYNLIENLVKVKVDALEDSLQILMPIPLYLGLIGTIAGIVIGIHSMPSVSSNLGAGPLGVGIDELLQGVKLAMSASFVGLIITTISSGFFFRRAKAGLDDRKAEFLSFLQTELLPVVNTGLAPTLVGLQNNLNVFNERFRQNVADMQTAMASNTEGIKATARLLEAVDRSDLVNLSAANLKIMREFNKSTDKFNDLTSAIGNLSTIIYLSRDLINEIKLAISRTDDFKNIAAGALSHFEQNRTLTELLSKSVTEIDAYKARLNTAVSTNSNATQKILDEFLKFVEEEITLIRTIITQEINKIEVDIPDRWARLDELTNLNQIRLGIDKIGSRDMASSGLQNKQLTKEEEMIKAIKELHFDMVRLDKTMASKKSWMKDLLEWYDRRQLEKEKKKLAAKKQAEQ